MTKLKIQDDFYLYQFPEESTGNQGNNIIVLRNLNKALFIDTGLKEQATEIIKDLQKEYIKPEILIISHCHADHLEGLGYFNECTIISSQYYKENSMVASAMKSFIPILSPSITVQDSYSLTFGSFSLFIYPTPGHSRCSMSISINDDSIYIGDLIMTTTQGMPFYPLVCRDGTIKEYIHHLKKLKESKVNTVFTGHGALIRDRHTLVTLADNYIEYLTLLASWKPGLTSPEVFEKFQKTFTGINLHFLNLQNIKSKT
jgi:glyoxylase-like metal-dependent hydrolase (beta-lactamase superfamily II)